MSQPTPGAVNGRSCPSPRSAIVGCVRQEVMMMMTFASRAVMTCCLSSLDPGGGANRARDTHESTSGLQTYNYIRQSTFKHNQENRRMSTID